MTNYGKVYYGASPFNTTIVYANPNGPMSSLKMREALQMSIDWKGLVQTIYHGAATLLRGPIAPAIFGTAKSALQPAYDALPAPQSANYAAAKKLVAEVPASVRNQTITMVVPSQTESKQFGLAVESAAQHIGLKFKLTTVPGDTYTNYLFDPKTRGNTDILYTIFWPHTFNFLDWVQGTAVTGGDFNQYRYGGADELYAKAIGTKDPGARAKIMVQIQSKLRGQLLTMTPGINNYSTVWLNKRITGVPASFDYVFYPWAAYLGGTGS